MTRDYGVVRNAFWESDTVRGLATEHKFLGLYIIASPHTNAIGCFKIPVAYVAHDTEMTPAALEAAFAALRERGFMHWCERMPWVWIPKYLTHNPPENPNVWRKCVKELYDLPIEISARATIAAELYDISLEERMSNPTSKNRVSDEERGRLKRFAKGIKTVPKGCRPLPCPSPCPEPRPEPEPRPNLRVTSADADEPAQAFADYNSIAVQNDWPEAQSLNATRRRALKARLVECGGLDGWRTAMVRAGRSDFLTGRTPRASGHEKWMPDLDFFLQQQSFTKLMEGSYDNHTTAERGGNVLGAIAIAAGHLGLSRNGSGGSDGTREAGDPLPEQLVEGRKRIASG